MPFWTRQGWTLGDALGRRLDRRLLRRAQANLAPVLADGEVVVAFDPATVLPTGGELPMVSGGAFVTLYLTDRALYVLGDDGSTLRIKRHDITSMDETTVERLDFELAGGARFAATPAPAPSRIARHLMGPDRP